MRAGLVHTCVVIVLSLCAVPMVEAGDVARLTVSDGSGFPGDTVTVTTTMDSDVDWGTVVLEICNEETEVSPIDSQRRIENLTHSQRSEVVHARSFVAMRWLPPRGAPVKMRAR